MKKYQSSISLALIALIIYNIAFLFNRFVKPLSNMAFGTVLVVCGIILIVSAILAIMKKNKG